MEVKDNMSAMLIHARTFTEGVLAELKEEKHWFTRACPGGNHAMWITGHLAAAENAFVGLIRPEMKLDFAEYAKLFGRGSAPMDDASVYPERDDVLQVLRERRNALLQALQDCSLEDLSRAAPAGAPPFMTNIAKVFQGAVWHESLHSGQLTVIHRTLGNAPLGGRPKA